MSDQPNRPIDPSFPTDLDTVPRLLETLVAQVAAAVPILERIARALEQGAVAGAGTGEVGWSERSAADEIRAAIGAGQWDRAEAVLDGWANRGENSAATEAMSGELARAKTRAVADWTDRLEAARGANDADGGLLARDELAQLLPRDDLRAIDDDLIAWLMKLVQRRLRSIPVGSDLAVLAARIADRFGGTAQGASLRAALPTLRRSAGLCPRCAEPYLGVDEACPECLAKAGQAAAEPPILTFVAADDLDSMVEGSAPIDLNDAANWRVPPSSEVP